MFPAGVNGSQVDLQTGLHLFNQMNIYSTIRIVSNLKCKKRKSLNLYFLHVKKQPILPEQVTLQHIEEASKKVILWLLHNIKNLGNDDWKEDDDIKMCSLKPGGKKTSLHISILEKRSEMFLRVI